MGTQKNNVVQYVFEGNVLNLEQAIKQVESLLRKSIKALKTYQDGVLDVEQTAQVKSTRALLRQLRAKQKLNRRLFDDERAEAIAAGKQALKSSNALYKQSLRVAKRTLAEKEKLQAKAEKEAAKRAEEVSAATSIAGQEQAGTRAFFLDSYADQLRGSLSSAAFSEIKNAIADFRAAQEAFKAGTLTQEELADATIKVNTTFEQYSSTLKNMKNAQQAATKGITDLKSLMAALQQQTLLTVQSFSFWMQALRQVIRWAKEGISVYADYVESLNFLKRAADDAADSMLQFTEAQITAFGLDPTAVNSAAAIFYSFADSMGFTGEQAVLLSQNMTKLAQDIASLQNIDVETAATKLRSALAGQSRALATLGVNVNDANIEEWLSTKGLNKSMRTMNEASQAAARYAFIIEKTASAQGDLSKTIGSPANQLKILRTQLQLLIQNLGALSTTLLLPLVKLLNQLLMPFNAFVQGLTSISASGFSSSIGDAASETEGLTDSLEDASDAARGLTGIDEINQITDSSSTEASLGIDSDIESLLQGYDNLATEASGLVPIFKALGEALAPIWAMLNNTTNVSILTEIISALGTVLYPVQKLLEGISWIFNQLPEPIRNVVSLFSELIILITSLSLILSTLHALMSAKIFVTFASTFKAIAAAIWQAVAAALQWVVATARSIAASTAQGIKNLWEAGTWWGKAAAIIAAAGVGALAVAAVAGAGVAVVKSLQSQSETQYAATGGVTSGPAFAMVGEGKYDEAIIPLGNSPQFQSMKEDIAASVLDSLGARGATRGTSSGTPVVLQLNGRELGRAILPDLGRVLPQTGVKLTR